MLKCNCRYVENDEAAVCPEDERERYMDHGNKRKKRLKPGLGRDGIESNNSDNDGNDSGYESSMGYSGGEEEKDNGFEVSIRKLMAESVLKGDLHYTQDYDNVHVVEREYSSVNDNADDKDIKYSKARHVEGIKEDPLSDLNLVAVGNGLQSGCSRGQNDSTCFVMKVEKVGV